MSCSPRQRRPTACLRFASLSLAARFLPSAACPALPLCPPASHHQLTPSLIYTFLTLTAFHPQVLHPFPLVFPLSRAHTTCLPSAAFQDVDSLNEQLRSAGAARMRHAMRPDEAFGLVFCWDNVVADTRALQASPACATPLATTLLSGGGD